MIFIVQSIQTVRNLDEFGALEKAAGSDGWNCRLACSFTTCTH